MKIAEILTYLEDIAPLSYQENYDNAGLIVGDSNLEFIKGLISLDLSLNVIEEAISLGCNLIITHHPFIFHPLKKLSTHSLSETLLIKAIKSDIAIYAMHTNLDNIINGVNYCFSKRLSLNNIQILQSKKQLLRKLVCFVPLDFADKVRSALFDAGCGNIGNYDSCSYNLEGVGSFKAGKETNPFIGEKEKLHFEKEIRIETIFPIYNEQRILSALQKSHPYEEVAYDIYTLENAHPQVGSGIVGFLPTPMKDSEFLFYLKEKMNLSLVQHSTLTGKIIEKVALCGGSGAFLLPDAIAQQADVFITGEIHYHDFLSYEKNLFLTAIGHYESEIEIKHYLYEKLIKKFTTFAVSKTETNPQNYFY